MANGLINLQTDLKSLRYGSDKPYITKNIGEAPGSSLGLEVQTRIDDTSRIAQMLIDKPGIKYLLHEAELQQVNIANKIRNRGNKTIAGAVLGQLGNTLVGTVKILGSTLAQVPVNGTGTHFLKGFRTDTYLQPSNGNQASGFAQFFGAGGVEGAQYALRGEEVPGIHESDILGRSSKYDYDDYLNSPIPADSEQRITKAYAEEGTAVPIGGSDIQTTLAPGELGISNQNVIQGNDNPNRYLAEEGSVVPISGSDIQTTLAPGELGISNQNVTQGNDNPNKYLAETGSIIKANNSEVETTATPGQLGISNQSVTASLADSGNTGEQKYTPDNTYTGKDSTYNIAAATSGSNTIPTGDVSSFYTPDGNYSAQESTLGASKIGNPQSLEQLKDKINNSEENIVSENSFAQKVEDFREGSSNVYSFNYSSNTVRRETRVNLGDQGKKKAEGFYTSYSNVDSLAIDQINALSELNQKASSADERDLAKMYFEIITPEGSKFLHFRAFIDSIDDSYGADWQGTKYVGRAENFYTYGGFERDISISFKIAAATRSEMKPLYRKMVYLASSTAPTYGGEGFMRGSLARITIGSYLSQLPGVITSVKYNLIDGMPWEIAMQNPEAGTDDDVQEVPMGLQCSVSFKVIHDFAPQTGLRHYFTNPNPANGSQPFFSSGEGDFQRTTAKASTGASTGAGGDNGGFGGGLTGVIQGVTF